MTRQGVNNNDALFSYNQVEARMEIASKDWQDMLKRLKRIAIAQERIATALETIAVTTTSDTQKLETAAAGLKEHSTTLETALAPASP